MKKYLKLFLLVILFSACKKTNNPGPELPFKEWVYEGDSITDISSDLPFNYPYQLVKTNASIAATPQIDVAHAGDQLHDMLSQYASQVHPYRPTDSTHLYVFALMAGTNDAAAERTSDQIYNDLKTEWGYAKADGFKVIAFCITRSTYQIRDTVAVNVNKKIIADPTKYDYLIRTDLILPNPNDNLYFIDGLHPTPLGSLLIAQQVVNVIAPNK